MTSSELMQQLTKAQEALTAATEALTAADQALAQAIDDEAAGGKSAKPARVTVQDRAHDVEVARARVAQLTEQHQQAVEAERVAQREELGRQLTAAVAELDAHPVVAATLEAIAQAEDFDTKSRAMLHLREAYVALGGSETDFRRRKVRAKGSRLAALTQVVGVAGSSLGGADVAILGA